MRSLLGIAMFMGLSVAGLVAGEGAVGESPRLLIRIYDYAEVPRSTLDSAMERTTRIFRQSGIELGWAECRTSMDDTRVGDPDCATPLTPAALTIRILSEKMAARAGRSSDAAGYALRTRSGTADKAAVFFHRVIEVSRQSKAPWGAVLAIFMAHEIGHLLLPGGNHSEHGAMRAEWTPPVVFRTAHGELRFSKRQAKHMRSNVADREAAAAIEKQRAPGTATRIAARTRGEKRR